MTLEAKDAIAARIRRSDTELIALSHRVHAHPELAFEEHRAAGWVAEALGEAGFAVDLGAFDLPTAVAARIGDGPTHVAICAEYDALPGIGHACGHNIIAAAAVGAGVALASVADDLGLTVTVLGTPAEESGGGKILMIERGAFTGVDAAMMVHPAPYEAAEMRILAATQYDVDYTGRAAHASAFPELGINALDALTVAQVSIGLMRQHITATDRIHGIVTHGGDAPNVVPDHTSGRWYVRASDLTELANLKSRLESCLRAGAVATGAEVAWNNGRDYSHFTPDRDLLSLYCTNAQAAGRVFAELPEGLTSRAAGSTDMGNVSLVVPSIHPLLGLGCLPVVNHEAAFTDVCITAAADRAVIEGAIAMAWTCADLPDARRASQLR